MYNVWNINMNKICVTLIVCYMSTAHFFSTSYLNAFCHCYSLIDFQNRRLRQDGLSICSIIEPGRTSPSGLMTLQGHLGFCKMWLFETKDYWCHPFAKFSRPESPQTGQSGASGLVYSGNTKAKKIRTGWITFQDCNSWILDGFLSSHNWAKICDYTRAESFVQVLKS